MGRVRTKTVKKSAKVIIERYYPKLTLDFETNKRLVFTTPPLPPGAVTCIDRQTKKCLR